MALFLRRCARRAVAAPTERQLIVREVDRDVAALCTYEGLSGTVIFGDGFDTNVWNYLQLKASYTFNDNDNVTLYGATNLGTTGLGARFYGNATTSYYSTTVGSAGVANLVNSSVIGGYYTFTSGNLTLVPEVENPAGTKWYMPAELLSISEGFSS